MVREVNCVVSKHPFNKPVSGFPVVCRTTGWLGVEMTVFAFGYGCLPTPAMAWGTKWLRVVARIVWPTDPLISVFQSCVPWFYHDSTMPITNATLKKASWHSYAFSRSLRSTTTSSSLAESLQYGWLSRRCLNSRESGSIASCLGLKFETHTFEAFWGQFM